MNGGRGFGATGGETIFAPLSKGENSPSPVSAIAGNLYGGGAGGYTPGPQIGTTGAAGVVIVEEFY
jgi:hypothetical protein